MAETEMTTPNGVFAVRRPHTDSRSPLRAWSAADQLALDELGASSSVDRGRLLIVNDDFGALTCGLAEDLPTVWTDSVVSRAAIASNLSANALPEVALVTGDVVPSGEFDTVVLRIPKTSALLDYQLRVVAARSAPGATVVGLGMVRHIQRSTTDLFKRLVGPTTTSRAVRKARLLHVVRDDRPAPEPVLAPITFTTDDGVHVAELPGTFSAGHLDVGTALLLRVLTQIQPPTPGATVADLGCGNGVIAATMARRWPEAAFLVIDQSDLAVEAARHTWKTNELGDRARFNAQDGFTSTPDASVDLVLSNPPFHQGHALDADLTDRLMADAARVLVPGGRAFVVAQRHLHMHTRLRQRFASVDVVSKHPSHVVLEADR